VRIQKIIYCKEVVGLRVNDRDIKCMVQKVNEIHTKVAVIETKCTNMENQLNTQSSRLTSHANAIKGIQLEQAEIRAKMWLLMVVSGSGGGLIGYIIGKVASGFLGV